MKTRRLILCAALLMGTSACQPDKDVSSDKAPRGEAESKKE